jgi:geranylgeranyl pyrophosphate synthase
VVTDGAPAMGSRFHIGVIVVDKSGNFDGAQTGKRIAALEAENKKQAKKIADLEAAAKKFNQQYLIERQQQQKEMERFRREFNRAAQSINRHDSQFAQVSAELAKTVKRST